MNYLLEKIKNNNINIISSNDINEIKNIKDIKLLSKYLINNNSVHTLNLNNCSLKNDNIMTLLQYLDYNKNTLQYLDLSLTKIYISDLPIIFNLLEKNLNLNYLNISKIINFHDTLYSLPPDINILNNINTLILSKNHLNDITDLIKCIKSNKTLTTLDLSRNYIPLNQICKIINDDNNISYFNISNNSFNSTEIKNIDTTLTKALKNNNSITDLNISSLRYYTNITRLRYIYINLDKIIEFLNYNNNIIKLDISNNKFDNYIQLFNILQNNNSITDLNLSRIFNNDNNKDIYYNFDNIKVLNRFIKYNTTVKYLDLSNNNINNFHNTVIYTSHNNIEKYVSLSKGLSYNKTINYLNLAYNNYKSSTVNILCDTLKNNNTLTTLELNNNIITDLNGLSKLLLINSTLTDLKLNYCQINNIDNLSEALKINNTLLKLELNHNCIMNINKIGEMLKYNSTLISLDISYNSLFLDSVNLNNNINNINQFYDNLKYNKNLTELNVYRYEDLNHKNIIVEESIRIYKLLKINTILVNLKF